VYRNKLLVYAARGKNQTLRIRNVRNGMGEGEKPGGLVNEGLTRVLLCRWVKGYV